MIYFLHLKLNLIFVSRVNFIRNGKLSIVSTKISSVIKVFLIKLETHLVFKVENSAGKGIINATDNWGDSKKSSISKQLVFLFAHS